MYVVLVTIEIQGEHREEFIREMILDAQGSRSKEPGCLQFDVLQDNTDSNKLYLYEVYRDRAAFDAHVTMPHLIKWRDAVKDWYAAPMLAMHAHNVDPSDADWR